MPTWTNVQGTHVHVAPGGGHKMNDYKNLKDSWFGDPYGVCESLPPGTLMIWQNEFSYLGGEVAITCWEPSGSPGYYNLGVTDRTWQQVYYEINTVSGIVAGLMRRGESFDPVNTSPSPQLPPAVNPNLLGQYGHWKLDETAGVTVLDSSGNRNGTLASPPTIPNGGAGATWGAGKMNSSLVLERGVSSYVDLPDGVVSTLDDITVSAWVNVESVRDWMRLFVFHNDTGTYMYLTPTSGADTVRFAKTSSAGRMSLLA